MKKEEFVKQQAEAFLNYYHKLLWQEFDVWAESKDFNYEDRQRVFKEYLKMMTDRLVIVNHRKIFLKV